MTHAAVRAGNTRVKVAVKVPAQRSSVAEQAIKAPLAPSSTERHRPKWLVVSSPKGGSGKTTSVVNLAVFAAHAGLNVAILDTDMQESAKDWWELRPDEAPRIQFIGKQLNKINEAIEAVAAIQNLDLVIVDTPTAVEYLPTETATLLEQADLVTGAVDDGAT